MRNWAGNHTFRAARVERPETVDRLAAVVRDNPAVRGVGTRHSFNAIADVPGGVLVSTEHLCGIDIDRGPSPTVTVGAGVTYGRLGPVLHAAGYALPNLASLPHISVAGSVATATHGSGESLGCLATGVSAVQMVLADGTVRTFGRGDAAFDGVVVHLGRLGVVTALTLDLLPTFDVAQTVYEGVPIAAYAEHLDAIAGSVYSVSGFTDWQDGRFKQVWMKALVGVPHADLRDLGGTKADRQHHPLEGRAGNVASEGAGADACSRQLGEPGPWHERLPHFRMDFTPSSGEELQTEYFVPRHHAAAALAAVGGLADVVGPVLQVSEVRLIAADRFWMSPFYERPSVGLHFTWRKDMAGVLAVLPRIEAALARFDVRPHWGKVSTFAFEAACRKLPRATDFATLARAIDVSGKFDQTSPDCLAGDRSYNVHID